MRVFLIFICTVIYFADVLGNETPPLNRKLADAITQYNSLQKELDLILKNKIPDCAPGTKAEANTLMCSLKSYCTSPDIHKDASIIYQNEKGEKISNSTYFAVRESVNSCLREKYSDEIKEKRDAMNTKLKTAHLKKIIAANKKLNLLADKYGQRAIIQQISSEILTMSLEKDLKAEDPDAGFESPDRSELMTSLTTAEKRTKTSLNPEIKKTLVEIEFLKYNPLYVEEVKKYENSLVPDIVSKKDLFQDWSLLKSAKDAGGASALKANRAKYAEKTQEAYAVFVETQNDILQYLDKKKNEFNIDNIDRIKDRVKTIKFNIPRLTSTLETQCESPNAFYTAITHTLIICPQYLNYPKMSLRETMAHEIAHSFDSCHLSEKFFKVKGPEIVEIAPFEIDIKTTPSLGNFKIQSEDSIYLKAENKQQEKMPYAENPFSKTLSCLKDPLSVGAVAVDFKNMKINAQKSIDELTKLGQNNPQNNKARKLNFFLENGPEYFSFFEGCNNPTDADTLGRSQMQEAFADKIASEIVALDIKKLNGVDAQKKILEIALGYDNICANESDSEIKLRAFAIKEGCSDFLENMEKEKRILATLLVVDPKFDSHPLTPKRIEKSILAQPDTRKALNCKEDPGVKYCE
ncbi:MAG: hypothetical protein H7281_18940 [Bacteriovorax sp.]|nr:hypothetical protein [Bacteriovorax sp.]